MEVSPNNDTRCGFIALLGRPNAGKSTLLNSLVGQKIAAVSAKQQTTRNRVVGLNTVGKTQLIFTDTPGLHSSSNAPQMNRKMVEVAWTGAKDADICAYLIDLNTGFTDDDRDYLLRLIAGGVKSIWVIGSKADTLNAERRRDHVKLLQQDLRDVLLKSEPPPNTMPQILTRIMSAKIPEQVAELRSLLAAALPEGPWLYDSEQLTDRPTTFIIAELIREQAFRLLSEELPYRLAAVVHEMKTEQGLTRVSASLVVAAESHKGMVIGAGGAMIKRIGAAARPGIEDLVGQRVFLDLRVVVDKNWHEKEDGLLKYLGDEYSGG